MTPSDLAQLPKIVAEIRKLEARGTELSRNHRLQLLVTHADSLLAAAEECERLRVALRRLVEDGECYCADGVAVRGPCGHCEARATLEGKP